LSDPSENSTLTVPAGVKKIIFVDGDIELDRQIILEKSSDPTIADGFLLMIVSGNIEVSSYLGEFLTPDNFTSIGGGCANQDPVLHGIFIADGTISFPGGGINNAFTNTLVNRNCDKKITVTGSFIGWGKNESNQQGILMERTFAGCLKGSFADASVPVYTSYNLDYNQTTPVITFVYDGDLLQRLPSWFKKAIWARFEVQ
jgi:hypothetical protein